MLSRHLSPCPPVCSAAVSETGICLSLWLVMGWVVCLFVHFLSFFPFSGGIMRWCCVLMNVLTIFMVEEFYIYVYGLNHSMGNRTEFSRMKGRSSGYSEGLLYSWDGIGWQQASRKSHIQGEKRPGRGHQGRLNRILPAVRTKAWHMGCLEGAGRAAFEETESATELWPFCTS